MKDRFNFVGETYEGEIYSSQPNTEKHILAAFGVKASIRAHFIDPVFTKNHRNTKKYFFPLKSFLGVSNKTDTGMALPPKCLFLVLMEMSALFSVCSENNERNNTF